MRRRSKLVLEFWDRKNELSIKNKDYSKFVNDLVEVLLGQDVKKGDMTSNLLIRNKQITAIIVAKENGVVAGLEEFSLINHDLKLKFQKRDCDKIKSGDILVEIKGNAGKILEKERISLNLLQRMSGIATLTAKLAKKAGNAKIAATRKTLWSLLDKKAVSIGNGITHRLSLGDGIIIKDNHLRIFNYDMEKALACCSKSKSKFIEVEVAGRKQAVAAASMINMLKSLKKPGKLFAIMFDNMKPSEIKNTISMLKKMRLYDSVLLEASGGIDGKSIRRYARTGVDVISLGFITHSAKSLDMSLEIK